MFDSCASVEASVSEQTIEGHSTNMGVEWGSLHCYLNLHISRSRYKIILLMKSFSIRDSYRDAK